MFYQVKPLLKKENPLRPWVILANVILPTILALYSSNATVILQDIITDDLGIDGALSAWMTIIYLLGINTIVPIATRIADRIGYKNTFLIGIFLFSLGTFFVALSKGFMALALSRLIEGIGAGCIFPVGLALVVKDFSKKRLPLALNIYLGVSFGVGFIAGPLISGYIGMYSHWSYAFFYLIPFSLFSFIVCLFFNEETKAENRGPFDYLGFCFFASSISCLLIALSQGNLPSTAEGWRTPYVVFCLFAFFVLSISTLLIEKITKNPIIPIQLFKYPAFNIGCLTLFAIGSIAFSSVNVAVEYMGSGLLYDRFLIGKMLSIYGFTLGIGTLLASIIMKKISPVILSLFGLVLLIISLFLNNLLTIQSGLDEIFWLLFLRGFALGISIGPITASALSSLPKSFGSDGATILTFFRQVGATYGSSIMGIVIIRRTIYHKQLFIEQVNSGLSAYKKTIFHLQKHVFAENSQEGALRAKIEIIDYVNRQAYIQALNDAFLFFGYTLIAMTTILCIINFFTYLKQKVHAKTISASTIDS